MKAIKIKDLSGWSDAAVYHVMPPMRFNHFGTGIDEEHADDYVVVNTFPFNGKKMTHIYSSDVNGAVCGNDCLIPFICTGQDHAIALEQAHYILDA